VELIDVPPGLAGVAVTATSVGDVLGEEGLYHYRGRSAVDLATRCSFEEVAALVLDGSSDPLDGDRTLPPGLGDLVGRLDLRSAISALGTALRLRPLVDLEPEERRADAVRLISALPTLVGSVHRGELVRPHDDLGHVAGYLWMVTGVDDPELARAVETYCILAIDHGFNASTFTARVTASTGADLGACVVAGFASLSGPRHGAVQSRVLDMFDAIGSPEQAEDWMKAAIAARQPVMGFGHSVYRVEDPRVAVLRDVAARVAPERHRAGLAIEAAAARVLAGRRLSANVDLYACVVLEGCGLPPELFTATFAIARVVGWCAHVLEQASERKIIRPAAHYVGPPPEVGPA
jgi:citrate synthase